MGYPEPSGEYYLGFEIKQLRDISADLGIDLASVELPPSPQAYRSYFTTIRSLLASQPTWTFVALPDEAIKGG